MAKNKQIAVRIVPHPSNGLDVVELVEIKDWRHLQELVRMPHDTTQGIFQYADLNWMGTAVSVAVHEEGWFRKYPVNVMVGIATSYRLAGPALVFGRAGGRPCSIKQLFVETYFPELLPRYKELKGIPA